MAWETYEEVGSLWADHVPAPPSPGLGRTAVGVAAELVATGADILAGWSRLLEGASNRMWDWADR